MKILNIRFISISLTCPESSLWNVTTRLLHGRQETSALLFPSMTHSSYMIRTLKIPMIQLLSLMKFRNLLKSLTASGNFTRQFQAHFIVTGSYLGRVLEPEFKFSSGDITSLRIYTLSFEEFLEALKPELYERYLELPLTSADNTQPDCYKELKDVYDIYLQIGGYPKVVETYLETCRIESAQKELVRIIQIFLNESIRYFDDITDISVFTNIFLSICRILLRE